MPTNVKTSSTTPTTTATTDLERLITQIETRAAEETKLVKQAIQRLARATRDNLPPVVAPRPQTLADALEVVLRGPRAPITLSALIAAVEAPAAKVVPEIKKLAAAGKIWNVGSDIDPRWTWVVGDETSTEELDALVERLIRHRPMTLVEIVAATGARRNRISGALVHLQRDGRKLANIGGNERVYRWFCTK